MLKCYVGKIAHRQYNFLMFNVDQGEFKTYFFNCAQKGKSHMHISLSSSYIFTNKEQTCLTMNNEEKKKKKKINPTKCHYMRE